MDYKTALALKESGFHLEKGDGTFIHGEIPENASEVVEVLYVPTLEKLIEGCGEDFKD